MSDNKKQMMDIQKVKSFSVAVSDEHQRNWGDDLFSRKENDPKYNYDRSRTRLNFQVSKGGELGPIDKNKSITDKIEQAIKNRVTGRVNATSNRAVSIVFGGNREQMRKLAFGDQAISENGNNWDVDSCSGIDRWATDIYDFCCREFGEENVVSFIVHLDELNPHAHAVIVPITKDGRLSAKDLFGGNDMNQARLRMRELHSRLAEVNEKYGLERGDDITITGAKHKSTETYRRELADECRTLSNEVGMKKMLLSSLNRSITKAETKIKALQTMVSRIVRHLPEIDNKYFDERKDKPAGEKTTGLVVVTADKGLAGAYNHNVLKMAEEQMQKAGQTGKYKLFVVGELGRQYFGHRGIEVAEQFHYTAQNPTLHRARIITETILEQFQAEQLDEVYIIYTNMVNSVTTEPHMMRLLPIIKERFITKDGQDLSMYQEPLVMTPSPKAVLDNIVPDFVMGYVYGALVESFCSEQNARMMAMEAANKNASAMIHDLSIQYNRVRQAMITQEITEVIAGAKAQKKKKKARKEVLSN